MYQDQPHVFQAMVFFRISKLALQRIGQWIHEHTGSEMRLDLERKFMRVRNQKGFAVEPILDAESIIDDGARVLCEQGLWIRDGSRLYKFRNDDLIPFPGSAE